MPIFLSGQLNGNGQEGILQIDAPPVENFWLIYYNCRHSLAFAMRLCVWASCVACRSRITQRQHDRADADRSSYAQQAVDCRRHAPVHRQCQHGLPLSLRHGSYPGGVLSSPCLSVCLSVCSRSYLRSYMPDLFTVSVHATYVRGLVNLWQRCDTLCTSGLGMMLYT